MSTPSGDAAALAGPLADAKALVEAAQAAAESQDDLFDSPTAEDMVLARADLPKGASNREVLSLARERRRGRPKNSRNKRTDDFARYILGFGQDPAITLIQIASAQPEMLIEASKQNKVHSFRGDGKPNVVVERMTYDQALSLKARCADILMPYIHGKKPIAIDMSFSGVADMFIEGLTHNSAEYADAVDAEFAPVDDPTLQPPERQA